MFDLKPGDLVRYREGWAWSERHIGEIAVFLEYIEPRGCKVYFFGRKETIIDAGRCFEKVS